MALPQLDNHDFRIRYYELMLRGEITGMREIPLPAGYHYELYQPGDRDAWIGIEKSAKEFETYEQGLDAWKRYYEGRDDELVNRMVFVVNEKGERWPPPRRFTIFAASTRAPTAGCIGWRCEGKTRARAYPSR